MGLIIGMQAWTDRSLPLASLAALILFQSVFATGYRAAAKKVYQ